MSELSIERAAELVLAHPAWERCPVCNGQGHISQKRAEELNLLVGSRLPACETCEGRGYFRLTEMVEAYRITNTPYPDKPMSGPDYYKQTMRAVQNTIMERTKGLIGKNYSKLTQEELIELHGELVKGDEDESNTGATG